MQVVDQLKALANAVDRKFLLDSCPPQLALQRVMAKRCVRL